MRPKVVSLFSGAGGFDIGFKDAGYDVQLAIEVDPACCDTLRANDRDLIVWERDIKSITGEQVMEALSVTPGEIDVVIGGPPCQSFSIAGKRKGLHDDRGKLLEEFVRIVRELVPRAFVLENVKGLANWDNGKALEWLEKELNRPVPLNEELVRYSVSHQILNAAEFGVPQFRERLFVVGTRESDNFVFPQPTHGPDTKPKQKRTQSYISVKEALGSLPPADEPSEVARRVSKSIRERRINHGF